MIKFESTLVTFTEVPDEIALCINCTCCPLKCKNCFEPWLQQDCGEILSVDKICKMVEKNPHITCICFMGGINDYLSLKYFAHYIKNTLGLKVALYSGHNYMEPAIMDEVSYYKIGPYMPEFGPLNQPTTNQRFYKKTNNGD